VSRESSSHVAEEIFYLKQQIDCSIYLSAIVNQRFKGQLAVPLLPVNLKYGNNQNSLRELSRLGIHQLRSQKNQSVEQTTSSDEFSFAILVLRSMLSIFRGQIAIDI